MFNRLFQNLQQSQGPAAEAEEIRQQLQSIFFKIKTYQKHLIKDNKLNFKVIENLSNDDDDMNSMGHVTYYLGGYAIKFDMGDLKSIQIYRRGKVDSLQFAELLAISFFNDIEYITDKLFVKADIYQLEILINHVIKNRDHY